MIISTATSSYIHINFMFQGIQIFSSKLHMIPFFGIFGCPFFLLISAWFSYNHSGKHRRDSVSSILSSAVLSISFGREVPETSSYSSTNWASQREHHTPIYLLIWLSVFFCLLYRGMKCPEPLLYFLNVFSFDEPSNWGVSLLSAYPLGRFVSYNRGYKCFWFLRECSFWLGRIWCFAVLIYAQISELSFHWCICHIHLKK